MGQGDDSDAAHLDPPRDRRRRRGEQASAVRGFSSGRRRDRSRGGLGRFRLRRFGRGLGQNRWYGRIGAPIVWQLGSWTPGRRTTLEFLPAVWLFGDNTDYLGGQTLKTDPLFQLDAHLTRDFTENFWGAIDASWYSGGRATVNGVQGQKLNNVGVGLTLGYTVNSNLNLTLGYKSTIGDSAPTDLRMDGFMVTLVYGWHPLIEGSKRLKSGEK